MKNMVIVLALALAFSSNALASDLVIGQTVLSSNGVYGTIVAINPSNDHILVKYETMYSPILQWPSSVARLHGYSGELNPIEVGEHVMSSNGVRGVVVGVYPSGLLAVKYVSESRPIKQKRVDLAKTDR